MRAGVWMLKMSCVAASTAALLAVAPMAQAAGCLKGAAVGGVAGHVAGHHGVLGAAAGCAVGHHEAAKKAKASKEEAQQAHAAESATVAPAVAK